MLFAFCGSLRLLVAQISYFYEIRITFAIITIIKPNLSSHEKVIVRFSDECFGLAVGGPND